MTFEATLARLSGLSADAIATRQWTWAEQRLRVGALCAFDRAVQQEHGAAVGDLRGVMLAIPDALLDRELGV